MGIFTKGINRGAYRGQLNCPVCKSTANRFIEYVGPYRLRYRCRKCGLKFQYDISNNPNAHPYAPFKKSKFQDLAGRTK
jgi:transposase-like protein